MLDGKYSERIAVCRDSGQQVESKASREGPTFSAELQERSGHVWLHTGRELILPVYFHKHCFPPISAVTVWTF